MSFVDLLRRLGILRSGFSKGVYTNAKDRPIEFMMDDVHDANKDLATKTETTRDKDASDQPAKAR